MAKTMYVNNSQTNKPLHVLIEFNTCTVSTVMYSLKSCQNIKGPFVNEEFFFFFFLIAIIMI